jgi:hypothetical protein
VHLQEEACAPAPPQSRPAERAGRRGLHRRAVRQRLANEAAQALAHRRRDAVVSGAAGLQPGAERLGHGVNDQLLRRAARESTEAGRSGCVCAGGGSNAFLGARERRHGDFANDHVQNHLGLVGGIVGESEGSGPEGGRGELGVSARCAARGAGQDHKHLALRGAEDDLALRRYCWVVP